ncbi:hypothetical protein TorRG33x02_358330 [Trema orientale]|uniref:Uncharacterized protein n=1 Tax=Trema orientale TaxID=63057 RepID=A0A2P5A3X8_TREOI|nr:hypothetical protein TorRG33x02_358330 [Trema orientale]
MFWDLIFEYGFWKKKKKGPIVCVLDLGMFILIKCY